MIKVEAIPFLVYYGAFYEKRQTKKVTAQQIKGQEFYGKVPFAVRAIFASYFGWFDGNPTTLQPLAPRTEAQRIAKLAGGVEQLATALDQATHSGDYQWAMQLADYLVLLEHQVEHAKQLKIKALTALAEGEMNAPTRNYYLSVAHEMREAA